MKFVGMPVLSVAVALLVIALPAKAYNGKLINTFQNTGHAVTGTVYAVDNKRFMITGFTFDGIAPATYFWVGKRGMTGIVDTVVGAVGTIVPNEFGSLQPLMEYTNKNIVITLPGDLTMKTIAWLGLWCTSAQAKFGEVFIGITFMPPATVNLGKFSTIDHGVSSGDVIIKSTRQIIINSLNYDGLGPQTYFLIGTGSTPAGNGTKVPDENGGTGVLDPYTSKTIELTIPEGQNVMNIGYLSIFCRSAPQDFGNVLFTGVTDIPPYVAPVVAAMDPPLANCMPLNDKINAAWEVKGNFIFIEITAAIEPDVYVSFGISGSASGPAMVGGDVAVVYMMGTTPMAVDYNLQAKSPCSVMTGACLDTEVTNGKQDISVVSGQVKNKITRIRYKREINTGDSLDKTFAASGTKTQLIWAVGPLRNQKVTKHSAVNSASINIDVSAATGNTCPTLVPTVDKTLKAYSIPAIFGDKTTVFNMEIGFSGGDRGYSAITAQQSWGIAWYVNQQLIPVLVLKRGVQYTFNIYGGKNPISSAIYHPFYITNDKKGGYVQKNTAERAAVTNYAGVNVDGSVASSAVGPYCEWVPKTTDMSKTIDNFSDYFKSLKRNCETGEPGVIKWTPNKDTPNLVYYQCYTHSFLGWKIVVVNEFSEYSAAVNPAVSTLTVILAAALAIYRLVV